jgi:hypothetical protein
MSQQQSTLMQSVQGMMQVLARKAKIVDNRYKFYQ